MARKTSMPVPEYVREKGTSRIRSVGKRTGGLMPPLTYEETGAKKPGEPKEEITGRLILCDKCGIGSGGQEGGGPLHRIANGKYRHQHCEG